MADGRHEPRLFFPPSAIRHLPSKREPMKKTPALAVLDFEDIPTGVCAVDAILKKASIAFVRAGTVTRGRYLVVFGGSTAATAESLAEALATCGRGLIDYSFLPDAHPVLFDAAFGARRKASGS